MKKLLIGSLLAVPALACLLAIPGTARAIAIALPPPPPGPVRVVQNDAIIVGRVMAIEDKDVEVEAFPGQPGKGKYRVAIVAVTEDVLGAKGAKTLRVGFTAPPMGGNPNDPVRPIRPPIRPGFGDPQLSAGQEGAFYLRKHHKEDLYLVSGPYSFTSKEGNPNFAKEIDAIKTAAKLLANPMEGLKAADKSQRILTAAMLVTKYRSQPLGAKGVKQEPIDAEESKLILQAIIDGDWTQRRIVRPGMPVGDQTLNSLNLFHQLGVTAKDGWQPPMKITRPEDYGNAAREWLQKNVNSYRIQRFVSNAK